MAFKVYSFWGVLRGYLGIYGTPGWIYGVEVNCTGDLRGPGRVYGDWEERTLSHLDWWDTPESFEASLQEAVNTIWAKLSQLEEGTGPVGTPTQDSPPGEPLSPGTPTQGTVTDIPTLHIYTPWTLTLGIPILEKPPGTPSGLDKG